jgi:hypothetical protein
LRSQHNYELLSEERMHGEIYRPQGQAISRHHQATGLKRLASNETIAGVLQGAGFAEISVDGSGGTRYVEALWPKADATAEIPPEVVNIEEIPTAVIAGLRIMTVKRKSKKPAKKRRKTSTARRQALG